jgi:hypothetical protein
MGAWNGWYHVDGHTYGTWLPGDPRGWRERKHREYVPGNYKDPPPPGFGADMLSRSRGRMRFPPVRFTAPQRQAAWQAMVEKLIERRVQVIALSQDAVHYHILARFLDGDVRRHVGAAKKHAYFQLRQKWQLGKVWQRLCNVTPIADRAHQVNVFHYIRSRVQVGAWVWSFPDGLWWHEETPD